MRGTEQLIAVRRAGFSPAMVFIETDLVRRRHDAKWPFDPEFPELQIDPSEPAGRLDLRCVVGLTVQVQGSNQTRVEAISKACIKAQAHRVISTTYAWVRGGIVHTHMTDTQGELTWPTC